MHHFSLPGCESSLSLFLLSYLVIGVLNFDPHTKLPAAPKSHIMQTFKKFVLSFLTLSLLSSLLNTYDFELYDIGVPINSLNHSILDLISLPHLVNNFLLAGTFAKYRRFLQIHNYTILSTSVMLLLISSFCLIKFNSYSSYYSIISCCVWVCNEDARLRCLQR